jgi:hypothetical protein
VAVLKQSQELTFFLYNRLLIVTACGCKGPTTNFKTIASTSICKRFLEENLFGSI